MQQQLLLENKATTLYLPYKSDSNNNFYFTNYPLGVKDEPKITLDYNTFKKNSNGLTSHLFSLYSETMLKNTAQKMGIQATTKKELESKLREKFEVYANNLEKINENEDWKKIEELLTKRYNKTINKIIFNKSTKKVLENNNATIESFLNKLKAIINKSEEAIKIIDTKIEMIDPGLHIVDKSQIERIEKDKSIIENGLKELINLQREAKNLYSEDPSDLKNLFNNNSEYLIDKFIKNYHTTICLGVGLIYEQKAYEVCQDYFDFIQHTGADSFIDKNGNQQHDRKTDMIVNELNISFKTISKNKKQNNQSRGTSVQSKGGVNSGGYLKDIIKDDKDLAARVLSTQNNNSISQFLKYTMFLKAIAGEKNKYQDDTIDIMIDNKHGVRLIGDIFSLISENTNKANVVVDKVIKSNKFDSFDIKAQYFLKEKF